MPKGHTEARVAKLPPCDLCADGTPAVYDFKTTHGPWMNGCQVHFDHLGLGLGLGLGQKLVVEVPNGGE